MDDRLYQIYEDIKRLEAELLDELQKQQEQLSYEIRERSIKFKADVLAYHRENVTRLRDYLRESSLKNILTAPIIWACLFPALAMDIIVSLFQAICFPIYGIPKVKRAEYIILDRRHLHYLNSIQKINCLYCGYFNGLISYVQEIAGRTEQYWCPIKHARKMKSTHSRYSRFVDFGDVDQYKQQVETLRLDFEDLKDER